MFAQVTPQTIDPWQMLVIALVPIIIQLLRARWPEITAKWWPTMAPSWVSELISVCTTPELPARRTQLPE